MVVMIIAHGPNEVAVPCMLVESKEHGAKLLDELFGPPNKHGHWHCHERKDHDKIASFFTSYYDGCGGVGAFSLKVIPVQTAFVPWSLD